MRLYKPRLFELLNANSGITSPIELSDDEFSYKIRHFLVNANCMVSGEPRYLHIKLNNSLMFELTGLYADTQYTLRSNWTELRTWDDFIRFLQKRWTI